LAQNRTTKHRRWNTKELSHIFSKLPCLPKSSYRCWWMFKKAYHI